MYRKFSTIELMALVLVLAICATQHLYGFEGCGQLAMDIEGGCLLFQADAGGTYTLDDYGGFEDGALVHVAGDPGTIGQPCPPCGTFQYPCLFNVSISECQFTTGCCQGRVGDVNLSGGPPTIGDISIIIDALFITGTCDGIIPCLSAADINQSGGNGFPDTGRNGP